MNRKLSIKIKIIKLCKMFFCAALARPSIDKARDSSSRLISLAADSLLYNAVSTIPLFLSLCL